MTIVVKIDVKIARKVTNLLKRDKINMFIRRSGNFRLGDYRQSDYCISEEIKLRVKSRIEAYLRACIGIFVPLVNRKTGFSLVT